LAAIIDAATIGVLSALCIRWIRRGARDGHPRFERLGGRWWTRVFSSATAVLDQQIGSPGDLILGLRTVDSRTGRRVALWRTLALVLAQAAVQELRRRAFGVRPPISQAEHAQLAREVQAINDNHPDDPDARHHATMRLYAERRVDVKFTGWRMLAGVVGAALVNQWLRRRLAPTVVVAPHGRVGSSRPHSP
jgi:hypothetical protein